MTGRTLRCSAAAAVAAAMLSIATGAAAEEPAPSPKHRATKRLSHSMWIGGVAMTAAGVANMAFGWATWLLPRANDACEGCPLDADEEAGRAFFIAGAISLGLGVPMIVIGTREVETDESTAIIPTKLRLGPGSVSASWVF